MALEADRFNDSIVSIHMHLAEQRVSAATDVLLRLADSVKRGADTHAPTTSSSGGGHDGSHGGGGKTMATCSYCHRRTASLPIHLRTCRAAAQARARDESRGTRSGVATKQEPELSPAVKVQLEVRWRFGGGREHLREVTSLLWFRWYKL